MSKIFQMLWAKVFKCLRQIFQMFRLNLLEDLPQ